MVCGCWDSFLVLRFCASVCSLLALAFFSALGFRVRRRAMDPDDVSFSLRPCAMDEVVQAMTATQPEEPFEDFPRGVRASLEDACIHAMPRDRRMLSRLKALLLYGEWQATALDLPVHPKLPGFCLVPARNVPQLGEHWKYLLQYDCFGQRYIEARKVLSTFAWHLSKRQNRHREFLWCRRAAWLLRRLRQQWRHERFNTQVV